MPTIFWGPARRAPANLQRGAKRNKAKAKAQRAARRRSR